MAESVVPGTYVEVRAEGLIAAARVATGIVGMIGTATKGPVGVPVTLSGLAHAREVFGLPDRYARPEQTGRPLTLVRALEQLYANGASSVIAVRVAAADHSAAGLTLRDAEGGPVADLLARSPGTWGNDVTVTVEPADEDAEIDLEVHDGAPAALDHAPVVPSGQNLIRVQRGVSKRTETLAIVYQVVRAETVRPDADGRYAVSATPVEQAATVNRVAVLEGRDTEVRSYEGRAILYGSGAAPAAGKLRVDTATGELTFNAGEAPQPGQRVEVRYAVGHEPPKPGQVLVTSWDGTLAFAEGEAPDAASGDRLEATYLVNRASAVRVSISAGATVERYTVPSADVLAERINASATAPVMAGPYAGNGGRPPAVGGGGALTSGSNGADAGRDEYGAGLDAIAAELVNIVHLAGQDVAGLGSLLQAHLAATQEVEHERIGVIGAHGATVADFLGGVPADPRIVVVAPGLQLEDGTRLPPAYTAAAVAGLISSVPVQASLTNRPVVVPPLALRANRGEQEQLIRRNVLAVVEKNGIRVLKGVTSAGEGTPFSAIPTRRIVDYAGYGVRSAANPFLGRLNNDRVRAALKATLDGFLTGMVQDEALTQYELEVSATRAQEIAGEVSVVMTLQPTFSIEYIRVVMNLR